MNHGLPLLREDAAQGHPVLGELMDIRQINSTGRRVALGRLMASGVPLSDAQYEQLDDYARRLGVSYDHFWGAYDEAGELAAAALMVPRPGRSGMMFVSPVRKRRDVATAGAVLRASADSATADRVRLLQSLVDPDSDLEAEAFASAGFGELAMLCYMQRGVSGGLPLPDPPAGVTCVPYVEGRREAFKAMLAASYEQTLDCPGLLGVRDLEDVLIGHQATGQFDAALWTLLLEGDEPAGVALFNRLDELNGAELVYLGLPPRSRGKGYGALLVRRGLAMCGRVGASAVSLAVDQANEPAMRLYRRLGFYRVARKRALTKVVSEANQSG